MKMKVRPSLAKHNEAITKPLRKATLCFLVKGNEILLAMKKRGFAVGKWNGIGGKFDSSKDDSIEDTAIRESIEEIGVKPSLEQVAVLKFYHLEMDDDGMEVTVFIANEWEGEPTETEEMAPKWFKCNKIPYELMWEDDILWLPKVLEGKKLEGDFLFDKNQKMLEYNIRVIQK